MTIHTGTKCPSRSHSTGANKLRTPRVIPSRTLFINSTKATNAPSVPNTPQVFHNQAINNRTENLANLRDILQASHQSRNKPTHIQSANITRRLAQNKSVSQQTNTLNDLRRSSQASLKDILKLADADDEISKRLRADANEKKVNKIEKDLQNSLRMLKHYNQTADNPVEETFNFTRKSFLSSQELLKSNQQNDNSLRLKTIQLNNKLNNLINQVGLDMNEKKFEKKLNETPIKLALLSSSSESILNDCGILSDPASFPAANSNNSNKLVVETQVKNETNERKEELISEPNATDLKTNYWKYNELEELRIRFTSLLTPNIKDEQHLANIQSEISKGYGVGSKLV